MVFIRRTTAARPAFAAGTGGSLIRHGRSRTPVERIPKLGVEDFTGKRPWPGRDEVFSKERRKGRQAEWGSG